MSDIAAEVTGSNQPAGNVQSDSVSSFSFGSLHEQALAAMGGSDTPSGEPAAQTGQVTDSPVAVTPQGQEVAENVDNATQAQMAALKDTDLVEVTVDGQPVQMPWSEAKGGVMRQAKFTKEMTALRQEQAAFNAERTALTQSRQERELLVNLLKDKNLLREFLSQQHPDLLAAQAAVAEASQGIDPEDIATVGQLAALQRAAEQKVADAVAQAERKLEERLSNVGREIEDKQATLKLANEINTTVKGLFSEHPYITKVIPNAEDMLRYQVSLMKPQTEQEAVEAFKTVFGGWVENYQATVRETTKQSVVNKQKLVSNNIQPPGGAGPQPQPTNFKKTNPMTGKSEIDWASLREAASNMLG